MLGSLTPELSHILRSTLIGEREEVALLRVALTSTEEAAAPQEAECGRLGARLRHVTQQVAVMPHRAPEGECQSMAGFKRRLYSRAARDLLAIRGDGGALVQDQRLCTS